MSYCADEDVTEAWDTWYRVFAQWKEIGWWGSGDLAVAILYDTIV
jgi:hypothetical protein